MKNQASALLENISSIKKQTTITYEAMLSKCSMESLNGCETTELEESHMNQEMMKLNGSWSKLYVNTYARHGIPKSYIPRNKGWQTLRSEVNRG